MRALLDVAHTLNGNRGGRVILKDANHFSIQRIVVVVVVVVVASLLTNIDTRNGSTLKYRG